jgi:hypothetical protein
MSLCFYKGADDKTIQQLIFHSGLKAINYNMKN